MPLNLSWTVFAPVFRIFGVVAVGLVFRRYSRLDVRPVTDLAMQVFIPCLAFSSLMAHKIELADFRAMVGSSALTIAGTGLLAFVIFRLLRIGGRGPFIAIMFLNAANLPFPLIEDLYGQSGLFRGVLYYIATSALIFSLGLYIVSRTTNFKELLRVPVLPALALALAFNFAGVRPPQPIMGVISLMGQAAIPLILFVFGHTLYSVKVTHIRMTLLCSALRIGGGLLMGILAIWLFDIEGLNRDIVLIYSIMPSAVVNVIISRKYEADPEVVASTVFLTTAVSLITIPIMLSYLGH